MLWVCDCPVRSRRATQKTRAAHTPGRLVRSRAIETPLVLNDLSASRERVGCYALDAVRLRTQVRYFLVQEAWCTIGERYRSTFVCSAGEECLEVSARIRRQGKLTRSTSWGQVSIVKNAHCLSILSRVHPGLTPPSPRHAPPIRSRSRLRASDH